MALEVGIRAPAGFTPAQRAQFDHEGYLLVRGGIDSNDVARYLDAIERIHPTPEGGHQH